MLLFISLCGMATAFGMARVRRAESRAEQAVALLETATRDAQEVMSLRASQEVVGVAQRPRDDVYAQISRTLIDAGIPSGVLRDLTPEGDRPIEGALTGSGPSLRTQSMRISLEPITPAQLGAFLTQWRSH
ncbi:hypothetical protein QUV00_22675, partial [Xanthomonas citri pv. citri]